MVRCGPAQVEVQQVESSQTPRQADALCQVYLQVELGDWPGLPSPFRVNREAWPHPIAHKEDR